MSRSAEAGAAATRAAMATVAAARVNWRMNASPWVFPKIELGRCGYKSPI
jgi:hypothetical protein